MKPLGRRHNAVPKYLFVQIRQFKSKMSRIFESGKDFSEEELLQSSLERANSLHRNVPASLSGIYIFINNQIQGHSKNLFDYIKFSDVLSDEILKPKQFLLQRIKIQLRESDTVHLFEAFATFITIFEFYMNKKTFEMAL